MGRRLAPTAILALLLSGGAPAAGADPAPASPAPGATPVRILAAASLTDVVEALSASFGAPVSPSFGASSVLARQIVDGAPADVYLSASPEWIDHLEENDATFGEPVVIARNRLVAIAPRGSALAADPPRSPRALLDALGGSGRIAIADEGVPAGEYARSALRHLGLLDEARSRLVGQKDVRAVLHAVEQDELDAGFVYATDARVADVEVLFTFDPETHPAIEYRAAVVRGAPSPEAARAYLDHLQSPAARELLGKAGFALP